MSFPEHDCYWTDTVNFLNNHCQSEEFIFAPDIFWEKFSHIYTYKYTNSYKDLPDNCNWAAIHKGLLDEISDSFLNAIADRFNPVFANEVFVVFTRFDKISKLPANNPHLVSLYKNLNKRKKFSSRFTRLTNQLLEGKLFSKIFSSQRKTGLTGVLEKIVNFKYLSDEQIRQEMNLLYEEGGYEFPTPYDQIRSSEIDQYTLEMIPNTANKKILDIACGAGRAASIIENCEQMVGIDISDVAIAQANKLYGHLPNHQFLQMNAINLDFPDNTFDIIIIIEAMDHFSDYQKVLREAFRVLKSGGCLLLNSANRDSLHLRITRALGYSEFKTNCQHIQEFRLEELKDFLSATGYVIQKVRGHLLVPYWGVPGVDGSIRQLTDNNPEIVQLIHDLGHQVSPEYTYCFFIACTKP